jgi:tetratricopeptide (TPR) repeat protein
MWGGLLQLSKSGPPLKSAKVAYQKAVEFDPNHPEPLIELGHYLYVFEDNNKAAEKCFVKAVKLAEQLLKEAKDGLEKLKEEGESCQL